MFLRSLTQIQTDWQTYHHNHEFTHLRFCTLISKWKTQNLLDFQYVWGSGGFPKSQKLWSVHIGRNRSAVNMNHFQYIHDTVSTALRLEAPVSFSIHVLPKVACGFLKCNDWHCLKKKKKKSLLPDSCWKNSEKYFKTPSVNFSVGD